MNIYFITMTIDKGADYRPQTIRRHVTLAEAENIVTFALCAALCAYDAAFIAAEMRGQMLKRGTMAWTYADSLKRITMRVEK